MHRVDVDLGLASPGEPGFSRRPDLVIFAREAIGRVDEDGDMPRADEVVVVVEIVSGSKRTDYRTKRDEYADAGIPHYWIVDIDAPVSLSVWGQDTVTGRFETEVPFPVTIDLEALLG